MGDRRISNVPTYWGARIRGTGVDLVRTPNESTAGKQIVERDGERARARQNRLGEARPTVPGALSWLMLFAVLMVLAVLSVASRSAVGPIVQAALVLGTAVAFASTLLLISALDHPYAGALHRDPTQTEFVLDQIAAEVRGPLPCDRSGLPTDAAGFRPRILAETDRARARYVQRLYGRTPDDPSLYHLVMDSTVLASEDCVEILAAAAESFWRRSP